MCSGGGGSQATIYMPDTDKYNQQFEMQKAAIEAQMQNGTKLMQQQLQSSLQRKESLMEKLTMLEMKKANDPATIDAMVDQRVATMMAASKSLIPEDSAQQVRIGASRDSDVEGKLGGAKKSGKAGLRIRRNPSQASTGTGVGLSITGE